MRASAQATTTKKLEGVCGSKEMKKAFEKLESTMMRELHVIKLMIAQMQYPNLNILPNYLTKLQQEHAAFQTANKPTTPEPILKTPANNSTTTTKTPQPSIQPSTTTTKSTTTTPTQKHRRPIDPNRSLSDDDYFVYPPEDESSQTVEASVEKQAISSSLPSKIKPKVIFHHKSLNFNSIKLPVVGNRFVEEDSDDDSELVVAPPSEQTSETSETKQTERPQPEISER